jgi:hypothetical protein
MKTMALFPSMRTAITLCLASLLSLSGCDAFSSNDARERAKDLPDPTYDKARITAVVLEEINFTDPARDSWDSRSGPDLFFGLFKESRQVATGNTRSNVSRSDLPLRWKIDRDVKDWSATHSIGFADADARGSDQIGGSRHNFTMMEAQKKGYVGTLRFSGRNGVQVRVELEWSKKEQR